MDLEMDIPLAEELEWLDQQEAEDEEEDFYYPEEVLEESRTNPDQLVADQDQICQKRPRQEEEGGLFDEKRTRKESKTAETDEDWLRWEPASDVAPAADVAPVDDVDLVDDVALEADAAREEEKVVCRFASEIEGECVAVTGPCGDRVYAKMSRWETKDGAKMWSMERRPFCGLLSQPISVLMERVEQEALTKALQNSSGYPNDSMYPAIPVVTEQLWVDKYAPNSFTELLSDEQTNREVLLWLKQWDSCVFGSQIRATTDDVLCALRRHSSLAQHHKLSDSKSFFSKNKGASMSNPKFNNSTGWDREDNNFKDISESWNKKAIGSNLPEEKVLLLCGPPGLGKTTLAHVAAKHCGYRVVEINASDDRSSSSIEAKILDVVQMNSVLADSKPKCLVIDEIDGALGEGKGAVEVILKMIAAEKKSVGKGNDAQDAQPGKVSSKRKTKNASLSRPVICICNDLYAPALRPLRQVAKVHTFVQPTVSRVVNRLKYICNKEGFKASSIALTALAEYTECDIRSCLNTLQFLNKKMEAINILEVGSQVVGQKDVSRSVFDVWKEIFQKKKVKRERKYMNSGSSVLKDFDYLHSLIANRGDYELTMDGIHENFLQLHYHDPTMQRTVKCLNMLGVSDSLLQYIMRTQQMSLYVYQSSNAIAICRQIAQVERPKIEWPKSFHRYRAMFMEKRDTLRFWHNKISPFISRHLSYESFVEDAVSPLLYILSPPTLKPVALHLLSEREKDVLAQLVDTMVSYSVTYKNVKPEPLQSTQRYEAIFDAAALSLDPPIDDFINFKDYNSGHCGLSLPMKQILLHEVEKQKILRESIGRSVNVIDGNNIESQAIPMEETGNTKKNSTTAFVTNNREKPKAVSAQMKWKADASTNSALGSNKSGIPVGVKSKAPGDAKKPSCASSFFDRFRKSNSNSSQNPENLQKQATLERDSRPLFFKFNEGFTNAVKRPVRIRELLP